MGEQVNLERLGDQLDALETAMNANQCFACAHENIEAANDFGTEILNEAKVTFWELAWMLGGENCG